MGELNVDPAGLQALAANCEGWSAEVAATPTPQAPGLSAQATCAAVAAVHADATLASATFAARMQSMAASLTTSSAGYATNEEESSTRLTDVAVNL